jgi:hypothetical protein
MARTIPVKDVDFNVVQEVIIGASAFDGHLSGTITTENGTALNGEIDALSMLQFNYDYSSHTVTARGAFDFTLRIPDTNYLFLILENSGLSVTPTDVEFAIIDEFRALSGGYLVGYVSKRKTTATSEVALFYMYANKSAVITGTGDDGDFKVTLAAGWNILVEKKEFSGNKYNTSYTTGNEPSGLQWTLHGYNPFSKAGFGLFEK